MNNAMSDSVQFFEALDNCIFSGGEKFEDFGDTDLVIENVTIINLFLAVIALAVIDGGTGHADALNQTFGENRGCRHVEELILD